VIGILIILAYPTMRRTLDDLRSERSLAQGRELAGVYCSTCHLEPAPDILPKRSWAAALGYMGYFLGIDDIDYLAEESELVNINVRDKRQYLEEEGRLLPSPLLDEREWEALRYYYVASAPDDPLPQTGKPELRWELPQFRVVKSDYRAQLAVTTMVRIREETGEAYIADSFTNSLAVVGGDGQLLFPPRQFGPAMSPVDIEFAADAAYVASIGDLFGSRTSEARPARIARLTLEVESIAGAPVTIIDDLYRLADIETLDLNGDAAADFVVSGFGNRRGSLSWHESQPDGSYEEHVLIDRPGAVRAQAHDFNGDGFQDIAALLADAWEGFYILINDGTNAFESHTVFESHSGYGHSYFELQDFDGDGSMDILTVNGDNVDSDPYNTLKNYHGLRIYLNRGDLQFEEAYFYPMYGAFGARAADFDNDGDLDIAAISFYPDFAVERRESFTYLENVGDLTFSAYTNEEMMSGRWMTLDAGDLDGDGDVDIVLGGSYIQTGMFAFTDELESLRATGPSILILQNTLN